MCFSYYTLPATNILLFNFHSFTNVYQILALVAPFCLWSQGLISKQFWFLFFLFCWHLDLLFYMVCGWSNRLWLVDQIFLSFLSYATFLSPLTLKSYSCYAASKEDLIPPVPILTRYRKDSGIKAFVKKELFDPRLPDERKSIEINVLTTPTLCIQSNTLYVSSS